MIRLLRSQTGQAQILAAAMIGVVMLTSALYTLQYTQQTASLEVRGGKRKEIRAALEAAIRRASILYHEQSACDPVALDDKLATLMPDGTISVNPQRRQLDVNISNHTYTVSFGAVTRLPWAKNAADPTTGGPMSDPTVTGTAGNPVYNKGTSQDAIIEVWANYNGQRVYQTAALIDTCNNPCSCDPTTQPAINDPSCVSVPPAVGKPATSGQCNVQGDRAIAYHRISQPAQYPDPAVAAIPGVAGGWTKTCVGGRFLGDLKATQCTPALSAAVKTVDIEDLVILKNYLRGGDWAGSCSSLIAGTGNNDACADFDRDGQVGELDQAILEKVLRGYLYWLPVHY